MPSIAANCRSGSTRRCLRPCPALSATGSSPGSPLRRQGGRRPRPRRRHLARTAAGPGRLRHLRPREDQHSGPSPRAPQHARPGCARRLSRAGSGAAAYSAWKRRPGDRLAPRTAGVSCRTLSTGIGPRGYLGPDLPATPSRLPPPPARPPRGPFPPTGLFVAAISSTTVPSDSRCAAPDFGFGLYGPPRRDRGRADGSLLSRASPCSRAAPHTPEGPWALLSRISAPRTWPSR